MSKWTRLTLGDLLERLALAREVEEAFVSCVARGEMDAYVSPMGTVRFVVGGKVPDEPGAVTTIVRDAETPIVECTCRPHLFLCDPECPLHWPGR